MKTIVLSIMKALGNKLLLKLCPWKRHSHIVLKLDKMTLFEVEHLLFRVRIIRSDTTAFPAEIHEAMQDDLTEVIRVLHDYLRYKETSKGDAFREWVGSSAKLALRMFF